MLVEALTAMAASGMAYYLYTGHPSRKPIPRVVRETIVATGLYIKLPNGRELWPRIKSSEKQPYGYLVKLEVPYGMSIEDFLRRQDRFDLALEGETEFETRDGEIWMYVYNHHLRDYEPFRLPSDNGMILPVFVGFSRSGEEVFDLVDAPHMLIGGTSGRGKTNFLHTLVISLLSLRPNTRFIVLDLKRMEFESYKNHVEYAYTFEKAGYLISLLRQELFRRRDILADAGCSDIKEYKGDMPYYVLLIDEFAQFSPELGKNKKERSEREHVHNLLIEMTCLARSVGIHIILCMQRPDVSVLPGQIKQNVGAVLAFRCMNAINSRILLDHDRAALLSGHIKGRAIYKFNDYEREVQVMHLPEKTRLELLRQLPPRTWSLEHEETSGTF